MIRPDTTIDPVAPLAASGQSVSASQKSAQSTAVLEARFLQDLWRAALSTSDDGDQPSVRDGSTPSATTSGLPLELLLLLAQAQSSADQSPASTSTLSAGDLRANERYRGDIDAAAQRTGISSATVAAIVGAEASSKDGVWDPQSRNPRSSAAGLTQFLASTWESEAERSGTYLNDVARARGWLDTQGRVAPATRQALLDLRFEPRTSIIAAADYAKMNLDYLRSRDLVPHDATVGDHAKLAYLTHHLGPADAERFLRGAISEGRSRTLLNAQIGTGAAAERIQDSGSSIAAHRAWLIGYVDRKINVSRYDTSARPERSLGAIARAVT